MKQGPGNSHLKNEYVIGVRVNFASGDNGKWAVEWENHNLRITLEKNK